MNSQMGQPASANFSKEVFQAEIDLVADVGEDITREALDRMGMARIDQRLFGKMDYKRACYLFHPDYAVKQALFVDSKAEKEEFRVRLDLRRLKAKARWRVQQLPLNNEEIYWDE